MVPSQTQVTRPPPPARYRRPEISESNDYFRQDFIFDHETSNSTLSWVKQISSTLRLRGIFFTISHNFHYLNSKSSNQAILHIIILEIWDKEGGRCQVHSRGGCISAPRGADLTHERGGVPPCPPLT